MILENLFLDQFQTQQLVVRTPKRRREVGSELIAVAREVVIAKLARAAPT
jgi:hypothetical protein